MAADAGVGLAHVMLTVGFQDISAIATTPSQTLKPDYSFNLNGHIELHTVDIRGQDEIQG
jgi:hypothetical protein